MNATATAALSGRSCHNTPMYSWSPDLKAPCRALAVPKRKKLFDDMGCKATKLVSLRETLLNGAYTMVDTRWCMTFASEDQSTEEVQVDSTFIVYTGGEEPKIVMYLPHGDALATLANRRVGS
jgi:hypothetical protein